MSAREIRRKVQRRKNARAVKGRTRTLSTFQRVAVLLYCEEFHELARSLPYKKDDPLVRGHAKRRYPKAVVLLFGVLSRLDRSLSHAEATLGTPELWEGVRRHWRIAKSLGIADEDEVDELPARPIKAKQWRYVGGDLLASDPAAFAVFEDAFLQFSIRLALGMGYFSRGSATNPDITSCLFADGTEVRSQRRSYVEKRVINKETGEVQLVAIDPTLGGDKVRAILERIDNEWIALDPKTGARMRKLPVDADALATAKYGATQSAYNMTPLSVRSFEENSRITLLVGCDETENAEAATILRMFERLSETSIDGRVLALITDMIIRGVHGTVLLQKHGVIPLTKVAAPADDEKKAAGSRSTESEDSPEWKERDLLLDEKPTETSAKTSKKKVKCLPLAPVAHEVASGAQCRHTLSLLGGELVEVDFDATGQSLVQVGTPELVQVKRRPAANKGRYRFDIRYRIACREGDFETSLCPHKSLGRDDGRRMAEHFRVFPESSKVFDDLFGTNRNTSEGGNAHLKNTYPHKRAQTSGRLGVMLDLYLFYIADNVKSWYFETGWQIADDFLFTPLLEVVPVVDSEMAS